MLLNYFIEKVLFYCYGGILCEYGLFWCRKGDNICLGLILLV